MECFPRRFAALTRILAIALLCCAPTLLRAQTITASVSGRVADVNGAVVPQAQVVATDTSTNTSITRMTNNGGNYAFPNLSPGPYQIKVTKAGFKDLVLDELVLNVQSVVTHNFALEVGSASETVTVNADQQQISTSPGVSTVIDRQFVENLPLNGRSFQSLIELTPGVVITPTNGGNQGQFSVNGQRSDSNYFSIDGVSASFGGESAASLNQTAGGTLPGLSSQGGTNSLVSIDAVQEFRVQTSSYAPEYGRVPGGPDFH